MSAVHIPSSGQSVLDLHAAVQNVVTRGAGAWRAARAPTGHERRSGKVGAVSDVVGELISRSNRLGSDPRNTNYAGGNTSAKGAADDPVTARGEHDLRRPTDVRAQRARTRRQVPGAPDPYRAIVARRRLFDSGRGDRRVR